MRNIQLFIGGSTNENISQSYIESSIELGKKIKERDYYVNLDGCMGISYYIFNEIKNPARRVIYLTDNYNKEYFKPGSAYMYQFDTQSDLNSTVSKTSDAMIFMKGEMSTISQIVQAIELKNKGEHDTPIVILNIDNEWDELVNLLDSYSLNTVYYVTDNVIDALNYIEQELFKETSDFYNKNKNDLVRKEPIIENSKNIKL